MQTQDRQARETETRGHQASRAHCLQPRQSDFLPGVQAGTATQCLQTLGITKVRDSKVGDLMKAHGSSPGEVSGRREAP